MYANYEKKAGRANLAKPNSNKPTTQHNDNLNDDGLMQFYLHAR